MERHEVLAMMTALKLAGMRAAYDDILADGLKRHHPVQQIIGTLLQVEIADKTARSIKYQMASASMPRGNSRARSGCGSSTGGSARPGCTTCLRSRSCAARASAGRPRRRWKWPRSSMTGRAGRS